MSSVGIRLLIKSAKIGNLVKENLLTLDRDKEFKSLETDICS